MNKRLFIAIDPPAAVREQLALLCCGLPAARWVAPDQLHLTLCFIGEVDGATFLDLREALTEIVSAPFDLRVQGVGFFPPRGQPRVVWAGIERCDPLMSLQRKIVTRLFRMGIELENRKYTPHITLARLQHTPATKVGKYLVENGLFSGGSFIVDHFVLYSSVLGRKGASHCVEHIYSLCRDESA
ncbi:MAG: RNA 2',3'-cyclic phosphodiesterase [Desulfobulbus sp.]|jgi:2'-5' RNA ligase|uniref:RNA 2',3'-cyclic phosphodiesterase n=1 Tax=Desulfobulbus sp. TaxID=895 RepID=UPI00283C1ADC|nr:RNA 2',3'-cyclic phosphodiesterase [Desulfobulbus sp.]MDR2549013.1 RNA 2',3'-cyclic phosphodiesterase [Desulfobulbus sp.]